jgi:hypothetical protein
LSFEKEIYTEDIADPHNNLLSLHGSFVGQNYFAKSYIICFAVAPGRWF